MNASQSSHYNWQKYTGPYSDVTQSPLLVAEASDGATIGFYIDTIEGRLNPSFLVTTPEGEHFSTESTQDWDGVGKYVPREEWPEPMFVGQRGPKERHPDPAVTQAIVAWRRDDILDRYTPVTLDWQIPHPTCPERGPSRETVTALVPDPEDPDQLIPWSVAANEQIDDSEQLDADADPIENSEAYEQAEDRLLERLGLTRDDVSEIRTLW